MGMKRAGITELPMFIGANALQTFTETEGTEDEKLAAMFRGIDADLSEIYVDVHDQLERLIKQSQYFGLDRPGMSVINGELRHLKETLQWV